MTWLILLVMDTILLFASQSFLIPLSSRAASQLSVAFWLHLPTILQNAAHRIRSRIYKTISVWRRIIMILGDWRGPKAQLSYGHPARFKPTPVRWCAKQCWQALGSPNARLGTSARNWPQANWYKYCPNTPPRVTSQFMPSIHRNSSFQQRSDSLSTIWPNSTVLFLTGKAA